MSRDLAGMHRAIVRVDGVPGTWRTAEPPPRTAETREEYDGGDMVNPVVVAGRPRRGEMTVTRGFDPEQDAAELVRLDRLVGRLRTSVSVQDLDNDLTPIGEPRVYLGLLREVQHPTADANSEDTQMWGLILHVYAMA